MFCRFTPNQHSIQTCFLEPSSPAGLAVRMPVTFIVMLGSKLNFLEKLFFAIAWSPKV